MNSFFIKAAKIAESGKKQDQYIQTILQPMENQNGFLFALLDFHQQPSIAAPVGLVLMEQLERAMQTFSETPHAQHRFEQMISAINETLAAHAQEEKWNFSVSDMHALIGIIMEEKLFLTGTGDLTALFLHKTPEGPYQIFNLSHGLQNEQTYPTWEKPFAALLDGDINAGDVFCITNQPLQRIIPAEKLNRILTTLPPQGSTEKIRQCFPLGEPIGICILKAISSEGGYEYPIASNTSLHLSQTEKNTTNILADQQPRIEIILEKIKKYFSRRRPASSSLELPLRHRLHPFVKLTLSLLFVTGKFIFDFFKKTKKIISQKIVTYLQHHTKQPWQKLSFPYKKKRQYLLALSALLLIVFVLTLLFVSHGQKKQETLAAYQMRVQHIENLQEQAAGSLIYKDEEQALVFLEQARQELLQLPQETKQQQEQAKKLSEHLQNLLYELQHVVAIPNPVAIASLQNISPDLTAFSMGFDRTDLYVSAKNQQMYRLNETLQEFFALSLQTIPVAKKISFEDQNFFLLTLQGISSISLKEEKITEIIPSPVLEKQWLDLFAYGSRLYVLEKQNEETHILRYEQQGSTSQQPQSWIRSNSTDISDAVGLAVDGTIFLLKEQGTIVRFRNGNEIPWSQKRVDPPITKAEKIWTDNESAFLYVLEPQAKRLLIFEKETGTFIVQYHSDLFAQATDFVVREKQKQIFFLAESNIYRIDATHIK